MDSDEFEDYDDPYDDHDVGLPWDDGLDDLDTSDDFDLFGSGYVPAVHVPVTQTPAATISQPSVPVQPTPQVSKPVAEATPQPPVSKLVPAQLLKATIDTSKYKEKLQEIVLKAVLSGHPEPIERALQTLNEHCNVGGGAQMLDFVPQKNSPVNVPTDYSCHSPLMIACEKERADLVKLLLEKGASPAFRNKDKLCAIHIACNKGNAEIVELLLTAASNQKVYSKRKKQPNDLQWMINGRNEQGWTPLMFAIKGSHVDIVHRLMLTGKVNYKATTRKECNVLHFASRGASLECLNAIFTRFKSYPNMITATDKNGWNILHHACASRNLEILKWLLSQLSEETRNKLINQQSETSKKKNKVGYTPLLTACEYQNKEAMELLIAHGADITICAKDDSGTEGQKSGLHIAAIHDAKDITELLLTNKCPLSIQDSEGNSPLHVAYKKSSFDVIAILRQRDDGKLERLENKDGVVARNIEPDDIIPPEIKKRGKEAIDLYKKALKEGKKKIPRCNLLILGQERVGKTSVYRLLVGLGFNHDQEPTLGIENKAIDTTVDTRLLDIELWEEKSDDVQKEQSKELFADGVVAEVRDNLPPKRKETKPFEPISEEQLKKEVEDIKAEIEREIRENPTPPIDLIEVLEAIFNRSTQVPSSHKQQPHRAKTEARRTGTTATHSSRQKRTHKPTHTKEKNTTGNQIAGKPLAAIPEATEHQQNKPHVIDTHEHTHSDSDQPMPPSPIIVPLPADVEPKVFRKHRHSINEKLKSAPQVEEKPSLILNTLDFAGQVEYRPMHHCFIVRRGMYMVVFNLQDMVKYIDPRNGGNVDENPLEEVRYWLHSIHAHIYPPDEDERSKDEKMSRVCLVGTHKAPRDPEQGREITEDKLKAINKLLTDELLSDDRCVDHIHIMEGSERVFVAVENSIDRKDVTERNDSGAFLLQHQLKSISSHLKFLEEDYPIIWLQFESELMRQREYRNQSSQSMVMKLEDLQSWANQQGITTPEGQHLAFQFFHDIGKIVYLRQTPTLFLNDEERDQLTDLVILDPAWLIRVMKVIFEMKQSFQGVRSMLVRDLIATGIASSTLLKACWEKFTDTNPVSFDQLCLMLQANCLIYPVPAPSVLPPLRAETDPLPSSSPLPTVPVRSQTNPQDNDTEKFFLVPCKLPGKPSEVAKPGCKLPWIEFYFDFQKFLPNEIYHRFICLMLADPESKKSKKNTYYNTCCQFYNIDGCNWKIELEKNLHRLKVSVLPKEGDERPPSYHFKKAHTEYLLKICQDSNLQGLEYYGGPLVKCDCGEEEIVEYVGYAHGKPQKPLREEIWCTNCPKKHDIDELLKPQPEISVTIKDETGRSKVSRSLHVVEEDSSSSLDTGAIQNTTLPSSTSSPQAAALTPPSTNPPTLRNLTIIKWKDAKGEDQKPLRIVRTLAPKWRETGRILDIEGPTIDSIWLKHLKEPSECCYEIFMKWLDGACCDDYPVTWAGLIELLVDMEQKHLADNLKRALQFLNIEY